MKDDPTYFVAAVWIVTLAMLPGLPLDFEAVMFSPFSPAFICLTFANILRLKPD